MRDGPLLACDWGTSQLRAWVLDAEGQVLREKMFPLGIGRLAAGEARSHFLRLVRPALEAETLPAILCGMVGSDLGWTTVPHVESPAGLADVAAGMAEVERDIWIVPGVKCRRDDGVLDVMRGEETQVLGWQAREGLPGAWLICLPGTHCKWVRLEAGRIMDFTTAMTGEVFELLSQHSVLRCRGPAEDMAAFDAGLEAAGDGDGLLSRLFVARGRLIDAPSATATAASFLSGLLIGSDVAGSTQLMGVKAREQVVVLGSSTQRLAYRRALRARNLRSREYDVRPATLAGLQALFEARVPS